jgi:glycosyltransferase involved in cell wall biosynthesis
VTDAPTASIVIPTRGRPDYLDVTLASVMPQASGAGAEVIVVSDGPDERTAAVAQRHHARFVPLAQPRGVNATRNEGIRAAQSDLLVFIDDDVESPGGWLDAVLAGVGSAPDREVFGGPIRPRLEGGPRNCGREPGPITSLDEGPEDHDVTMVWGTNMAIRRSAFERVGLFDDSLSGRGDEEEWELRYTAAGGHIRYLANAGLDHRRARRDARLGALARHAYEQGREARRHDTRSGKPRPIPAEARILAGCAWHTLRRRCAYGIVMGARAAGSLREALARRQA